MIRFFFSFVKMLAVMLAFFTVAYFSGINNLPLSIWIGFVALVCFGWCGWLWFNGSGWKWRLLIATSFAIVVSGLSFFFYGDYLIGLMGGRHIGPQENPLSEMAHLSNLEGTGLILAGILLMTYVDYRRPVKPTRQPFLLEDEKASTSQVWPPAPKLP